MREERMGLGGEGKMANETRGLFVKNKKSEDSKLDFLIICSRSQNPVLTL